MPNKGHRNSNERGNSCQRHARKLFLLDTFGDGITAPCSDCGEPVSLATIFVDRIITREDGGTYARDNIQPHCQTCSCRQGAAMTNRKRRVSA